MSNISEELVGLYEGYRIRQHRFPLDVAEKFFAPLLIDPPAAWEGAQNRIAYIGQETLGWNWSKEDAARFGCSWNCPDLYSLKDFFVSEQSVAALMDGYRQFDFSASRPINYRSPFWQYFREIHTWYSQRGRTASVLFSNVIRCAADSKSGFTLWSVSPEERRTYIEWQHGLLKKELRIIKPTVILFVCGPRYDSYLKEEFGNLTFTTLEKFKEREAAKLHSADLPAPAYRTYHPGYLNRTPLKFDPLRAAIEDAGELGSS